MPGQQEHQPPAFREQAPASHAVQLHDGGSLLAQVRAQDGELQSLRARLDRAKQTIDAKDKALGEKNRLIEMLRDKLARMTDCSAALNNMIQGAASDVALRAPLPSQAAYASSMAMAYGPFAASALQLPPQQWNNSGMFGSGMHNTVPELLLDAGLLSSLPLRRASEPAALQQQLPAVSQLAAPAHKPRSVPPGSVFDVPDCQMAALLAIKAEPAMARLQLQPCTHDSDSSGGSSDMEGAQASGLDLQALGEAAAAAAATGTDGSPGLELHEACGLAGLIGAGSQGLGKRSRWQQSEEAGALASGALLACGSGGSSSCRQRAVAAAGGADVGSSDTSPRHQMDQQQRQRRYKQHQHQQQQQEEDAASLLSKRSRSLSHDGSAQPPSPDALLHLATVAALEAPSQPECSRAGAPGGGSAQPADEHMAGENLHLGMHDQRPSMGLSNGLLGGRLLTWQRAVRGMTDSPQQHGQLEQQGRQRSRSGGSQLLRHTSFQHSGQPSAAPEQEQQQWAGTGLHHAQRTQGLSGPLRHRKPSWFQTEINEKIPLSVQQACVMEWHTKACVTVVCAELYGTFFVNSAGEFHIKQHVGGEVVSPNKFEELAGKKTARNWQQSIRLADHTMTGEPGSALLKLGHFTRIVGLTADRM